MIFNSFNPDSGLSITIQSYTTNAFNATLHGTAHLTNTYAEACLFHFVKKKNINRTREEKKNPRKWNPPPNFFQCKQNGKGYSALSQTLVDALMKNSERLHIAMARGERCVKLDKLSMTHSLTRPCCCCWWRLVNTWQNTHSSTYKILWGKPCQRWGAYYGNLHRQPRPPHLTIVTPKDPFFTQRPVYFLSPYDNMVI